MQTILVVEDQPEVRELIQVTMETEPYHVLMAENGQQAREMVQKYPPDLILLDVMLPDGPDGLQICQELKADPATRETVVILLTAKGQEADIAAGFEAGADDYFVKPFSPLQLIEKVSNVLK